MLLSRSRQDSCVAQATDPAHAGACNFRWPISSGTHLFTRPAKQSRDRWDFLWSPALPPRGKPGHLYCHLTAKLVRPCTGHVRDMCSVWVLRTENGQLLPLLAARLVPGHTPLCFPLSPALVSWRESCMANYFLFFSQSFLDCSLHFLFISSWPMYSVQ